MAITKERKQKLVAQYVEDLQRSQGIIFAEYKGLAVKDLDELRAGLREKGGGFTVVKLTLFRLALEEAGMPLPDELLDGPVGIIFMYDDLAGVAKSALDYSDDNENLVITGALTGDAVHDLAGVEALSELPSADQIRAQLVGILNAPASKLVTIFSQPSRDLVGVINAGANKLVNVVSAYANKQEAA